MSTSATLSLLLASALPLLTHAMEGFPTDSLTLHIPAPDSEVARAHATHSMKSASAPDIAASSLFGSSGENVNYGSYHTTDTSDSGSPGLSTRRSPSDALHPAAGQSPVAVQPEMAGFNPFAGSSSAELHPQTGPAGLGSPRAALSGMTSVGSTRGAAEERVRRLPSLYEAEHSSQPLPESSTHAQLAGTALPTEETSASRLQLRARRRAQRVVFREEGTRTPPRQRESRAGGMATSKSESALREKEGASKRSRQHRRVQEVRSTAWGPAARGGEGPVARGGEGRSESEGFWEGEARRRRRRSFGGEAEAGGVGQSQGQGQGRGREQQPHPQPQAVAGSPPARSEPQSPQHSQ